MNGVDRSLARRRTRRAGLLLLVLAWSAACGGPAPPDQVPQQQVLPSEPVQRKALFDLRAIARGSLDTLQARLGDPVASEISHGGVQAVLHYELSGGATVRIMRRMDQTRSMALWLAQGVPTPDDLLALVGLGPDDLSKTMEGPRQVDWVDPAEDITIAITARALGEGGWASLEVTVSHVPSEQPGK